MHQQLSGLVWFKTSKRPHPATPPTQACDPDSLLNRSLRLVPHLQELPWAQALNSSDHSGNWIEQRHWFGRGSNPSQTSIRCETILVPSTLVKPCSVPQRGVIYPRRAIAVRGSYRCWRICGDGCLVVCWCFCRTYSRGCHERAWWN